MPREAAILTALRLTTKRSMGEHNEFGIDAGEFSEKFFKKMGLKRPKQSLEEEATSFWNVKHSQNHSVVENHAIDFASALLEDEAQTKFTTRALKLQSVYRRKLEKVYPAHKNKMNAEAQLLADNAAVEEHWNEIEQKLKELCTDIVKQRLQRAGKLEFEINKIPGDLGMPKHPSKAPTIPELTKVKVLYRSAR